uniref:Kunitz/Bovine pancreatic trypsin inhibitor domain protein n=1 Tax=Angiostrongylus cantonensis TaxID=6313 RepID=A0A158P8Y2_ANGCA
MKTCFLLLFVVIHIVDAVDPCKRQPFRGRCPSQNGESPKRSQFVLRYYMRSGECVSYPYGHCANDESEPQLYRYKEECEDACINPPPVFLVDVLCNYKKSDTSLIISTSECERRRAHAAVTSIRGGFVPVCTAEGDFENVQCEPDGRQCFCVDARGLEIANSRTRNGRKPDCNSIQSASTPRTKDCVGGSVRGPCSGSLERWYYDEDEAECKKFIFSGCGGNGNNYESKQECVQRCAPPPMGLPKCEKGEPLKTKLGVAVNCAKSDCPSGYKCSIVQQSSVCCPENNKIIGLQMSRSDVCSLPKDRGPCDKYELRFYFNAELKECKYFFWGGCEGNGNNFEKVEECESTCGIIKGNLFRQPPISFKTTQGIRITPSNRPMVEELITLGKLVDQQSTTAFRDPGNCRGQFVRWYWDNENKVCDVFTYTGCQGNGNNYANREECLAICHKEDFSNVCRHDVDSGECNGIFQRFAFDMESGECRPFTYGGCGGNGNNFATLAECRIKCQKVALSPGNLCEHDIEVGECSGVFVRFGYDKLTNDCRQFTYGGCGGNGNNFATVQECRNVCVKKLCNPNPQCDLARCQIVNDRNGCPFCSCPPVSQPIPPGLETTPCPEISVDKCKDPCILINNRKGCKAGLHMIQFLYEPGPCKHFVDRWYFNSVDGTCHPFKYGGCAGNRNHFFTQKECEIHCARFLQSNYNTIGLNWLS